MAWRKKVIGSLLAVGLAASALAGCGSTAQPGTENTPTGGATSTAPENRTELFMGFSDEPSDGFDPTVGWGGHGAFIFQNALVTYDPELNIVGDLASDYTVSDDGLHYTFNLRDDVTFSDGTPFTSKDVVFTYEKAMKTSTFIDLTNLDSVKADGDHTVVFTLKEPQSLFPHLVVSQGIVPAHLYDENTYNSAPVGTGPFVLKTWDRGQQLILERNDSYHGNKPYFEKLTFAFLSEEAALAAASSGTMDLIATSPTLATQEIPGMELLKVDTYDPRGIALPSLPTGQVTREDGIPVGNDVTSDPAIRKAINLAVDRQAIVDGVINGLGNAVYSESDGMPWANPEAVFQDNDPAAAEKILDEAGWVDSDGDGVREKDGVKAEFTILYSAGDSTRQSIAMVTADMIKPLGIIAKPEGRSWEEIDKLLYSTPWVLGTGQMSPMVLTKLYASQFAGQGYNNTSYYGNATVDDYFAKALATTDEDKANEFWRKAQWDGTTGTAVAGDAPMIWLVNPYHLYYASEKLDTGMQRKHGHGHGWQVVQNVQDWKWK